jgi:hypothetical protein
MAACTHFARFVALPLQEKLSALTDHAQSMFADRVHVGGVAWSRAHSLAGLNEAVT